MAAFRKRSECKGRGFAGCGGARHAGKARHRGDGRWQKPSRRQEGCEGEIRKQFARQRAGPAPLLQLLPRTTLRLVPPLVIFAINPSGASCTFPIKACWPLTRANELKT